MSFDMNIPRNLSNVQASHKSCDGGGGNTGYFLRGNGKEEDTIEFSRELEKDSFEKEGSKDKNAINFLDMLLEFFARLFNKIKKLLKIK